MTRRPVLRATLLAACALFVLGAPTGAGAADAAASGWWSKLQSGQLVAVPAPPGVDDGELFVQGAPDGASAIAAVRYTLGESETAPVLQLRFADEGAGETAAAAVVLACATTSVWNSGGNQAWPGKPAPDCARQAIGEVADDGASMVFDLSSFSVGTTVDVVIVPGRVEGLPEGADGSSFALTFAAPTETDLITQAAGAPIQAPPATAPTPQPAASTAASPAPSSGGSTGTASVAPSSRPLPSFQPPATPAAPALPASELASPAGSAATTPAAFDTASVDRGDAKTFAVVLLLGAAAATLAAGRRGALLQLLGGVPADAAPAVAGVGRFARERDGLPPTLR